MLEPEQEALVRSAADRILEGGIVITPTETFYALAADPFNERAVNRLFQLKGRERNKPIALIASDARAVEHLIGQPRHEAAKLMKAFWPGSLTILFRPVRDLPGAIAGPNGKIGVRIPPACPAKILASLVGGLITATSANLSGGTEPDEISKISPCLIRAVDFVLDFGITPGGKPSTVVDVDETGIHIIREGAISGESLLFEAVHNCP